MKVGTGKSQYRTIMNRPSKDHILTHLKTLLMKSLIVLVIILIALVISSINTPSANNITEKVKNTISYEYKPLEDSKRVYNWTKEKVKGSISSIPTMKTNPTYMAPIQGKVYRKFNQDVLIDGNIVKNGGLDIIVEEGANPISVINGVIERVEERDKKGFFVTVVNEDMTVVYGYLKTAFVKEGETIQQGTEVGSIGTNKDGSRYLRFEIYVDNIAVDPSKLVYIKP